MMHEQLRIRKKAIINEFLKKGILLNSDVLNSITEHDNFDSLFGRMSSPTSQALVISTDTSTISTHDPSTINWAEIERMKVFAEKGKGTGYEKAVSSITERQAFAPQESYPVKPIFSYTGENKKREVEDFVDYFNHRYKAIEKMLRARQGISNQISIKMVLKKKEKEAVTVIGMVESKDSTKNGNIMLTVEDPSGSIKVLVNKNKPELFRKAEDMVPDEVIAVLGVCGDNIIFANDLFMPDVPLADLKKASDDIYAAFLSDIHVGSSKFLPDDFNRFLQWIRGDVGNEKQREIASKVKYLFISGDLVDGVGIYPGQEDELDIKDIYDQYKACAELLLQVPKHIKMIICPGNHDAIRLAEPQPAFSKEYSAVIHAIPNATIVTNPALVNIHASEDFVGFNVLMYHGYSFDHYVAEVNSLRNQGGYDRADLIMKFLLQRRHLAPTHTSTPYIPDNTFDPLVIDTVPDFFISGHIHKSISANYKNITLICGSCWQGKTAFQEKMGHHPEPSRLPVVNLNTREIKILKFGV